MRAYMRRLLALLLICTSGSPQLPTTGDSSSQEESGPYCCPHQCQSSAGRCGSLRPFAFLSQETPSAGITRFSMLRAALTSAPTSKFRFASFMTGHRSCKARQLLRLQDHHHRVAQDEPRRVADHPRKHRITSDYCRLDSRAHRVSVARSSTSVREMRCIMPSTPGPHQHGGPARGVSAAAQPSRSRLPAASCDARLQVCP